MKEAKMVVGFCDEHFGCIKYIVRWGKTFMPSFKTLNCLLQNICLSYPQWPEALIMILAQGSFILNDVITFAENKTDNVVYIIFFISLTIFMVRQHCRRRNKPFSEDRIC